MHFLSVSTALGSRCPVQSGGVRCTDQRWGVPMGTETKGMLLQTLLLQPFSMAFEQLQSSERELAVAQQQLREVNSVLHNV